MSSTTSSMMSSTTPAYRLTYAKDARGHTSLSYPYSSTNTAAAAPPQLSRLHYAKDSRGHTALRYPYSSSTSPSQTSFSATTSSRHSMHSSSSDSDDEERQSLTATEDSINHSSSLYTGADGQFRGIYDRSQSTNLVKVALRGQRRRAN